jgi:hypothetical protein
MTQFPVKEIQQFTIHHNGGLARCVHEETPGAQPKQPEPILKL